MRPRSMDLTLSSRLLVGLLALAMVHGIGGCKALDKHRNKKVPQPGQYDPYQPRELNKVSLPAYIIEPPDELEIAVRPATLDLPVSNVIVRQDGVVDLGFLGEIYINGLTVPEAELKIAQHAAALASAKKVTEPIQASVRVVSGGRSKQYYVVGAVAAPGAYPITGNEMVLDAVLKAGLKRNSLPDKAYLARPHPQGGPEQLLRIDWECILRGETFTNYQLMPGDRVVIPGGREPGLAQTFFGG